MPKDHHSPLDRRGFLSLAAGTGAALLLGNRLEALPHSFNLFPGAELVQRPIPSSGEKLPVIGIGTARRYDVEAIEANLAPLREVLKEFPTLGGRILDTAPGYGRAEAVSGRLIKELGNRKSYFLATKVSAGAKGGRTAAVAEMERSMTALGTEMIDLMQVWNLTGTTETLPLLREWKAAGKIRYYGVTTSSDRQYPELEALLKQEKLDLIQVDYAIDNRGVEEKILPLALDKGVGVLVNGPFGRGRVLSGFTDKKLPEWAREIGITSWAQFALKWIVGHPAITAAIPGTAQMKYLVDNIEAAKGPMPDEAMRKKMLAFFEAN